MHLLVTHKVILIFEVNKSTPVVINEIIALTKCQPTNINIIEMKLKPSFFDPLNSRGIVRFRFLERFGGNYTKIYCEIIPFYHRRFIYILCSILLSLAVIILLISPTIYTFMSIFCGGILVFSIVYLGQGLNLSKIENRIGTILKTAEGKLIFRGETIDDVII